MLAAGEVGQVARTLAGVVVVDVVAVAEGLGFQGVVVGVADAHVQDEVDVKVDVLGEEFGDASADVAVGGPDRGVDAVDVDALEG